MAAFIKHTKGALQEAGNYGFGVLYGLDQLGNALIPRFLLGKYARYKDETWSSAMGKQLAVRLYEEKNAKNYPWKYPVGKLFNSICNVVEKNHSLKSIEWDEGVDLEKEYPGIKKLVAEYLASH